ncbi:MAG: beta-lactamase family protein [Proteobacteria bacterium]|nr:beta-lactamase family protein [Pseudomonadota bacterium]
MLNRRQMIALGLGAAAAAGGGTLRAAEHGADDPGPYARAFEALDRYVAQYLAELGAPGLTLALADAGGVRRVVSYGLVDVGRQLPVRTDALFQIGSITKSFVALALLQLVDAGRLELERPIAAYLPWLRFDSPFRPISVHDLLTHGAGLPDGPLFPADPAFRHRAANPPGQDFHYCNMGWEALGHLLAMLDGRPMPEALRARIFAPLGMTESEPATTFEMRQRLATSYYPLLGDRPYPLRGRLVEAPAVITTSGAGCIAATPRDMGRYLAMLARRGAGPRGRLVSEAAFARFSHPYIAAAEFGNDAHYGYGIAVDRLDGHTRLRHTGGMVSFASALEVDLEEGVGAFASVNAMQGLRPRPVAEYALRLMRACRAGAALPEPPAALDPRRVANAQDYAGRYLGQGGRALETVADGERLFLLHGGERVALEPAIGLGDAFLAAHRDYARFPLLFTRADPADPHSAVLEAGHGDAWYARPEYRGPREFKAPAEWAGLTGHYRSEDPWIGSHRVALRRGQLWLDGVVPLEAGEGGVFHLRDEERSPEWVRFGDFALGRAMRLTLSGADLIRLAAP